MRNPEGGPKLDSKYVWPGDEHLKERDRKLNVAFREFNELAERLSRVSNVVVREADSDGGAISDYEPAALNTDKMAEAKAYMARMVQLIAEIENIEGIIDTKAVRKELPESKGTESEQ